MIEKTRPLEDVTAIKCLHCGQELVIDKKLTTTDYECCNCSTIMTVKFFKNEKKYVEVKKRGNSNK